jgi:hypothetical protein
MGHVLSLWTTHIYQLCLSGEFGDADPRDYWLMEPVGSTSAEIIEALDIRASAVPSSN